MQTPAHPFTDPPPAPDGVGANGGQRIRRDNLVSFVVIASGDLAADRAWCEAVATYAAEGFEYHELVLVAAAPGPDWTAAMRELGCDLPHLRVIVIDRRQGFEQLFADSLQHAIGDYVFCTYPGAVAIGELDGMVTALASGTHDVVKAVHARQSAALGERIAAEIRGGAIRAVTGQRIEAFPARAVGLSRTAISRLQGIGGLARYVRVLDLSGQLPLARVMVARAPQRRFLAAFPEKLRVATEILSLSTSRLILSLAMICFVFSLASVAGMVTAVVIKFAMEDVAPGWTSLAVLIMGVFAANFGVLGAICIGLFQLLRQGRADPSDPYTTEISGGDFRRSERQINVETADEGR